MWSDRLAIRGLHIWGETEKNKTNGEALVQLEPKRGRLSESPMLKSMGEISMSREKGPNRSIGLQIGDYKFGAKRKRIKQTAKL